MTQKTRSVLPIINVYFESKESIDFFAALIDQQPIKKSVKAISGLAISSDGFPEFPKVSSRKMSEFLEKSIICLTQETRSLIKEKEINQKVVFLPSELPPGQLIFEHLYNLHPSNDFWKNDIYFSRSVFTNIASDVIREFSMTSAVIDVKKLIATYQESKRAEEIFKLFYKGFEFSKLTSYKAKPYNPWKHWVESNPEARDLFLEKLNLAICSATSHPNLKTEA